MPAPSKSLGRVGSNPDDARTNALEAAGLIPRQARFLVTVMLHSGVFVGRQYAAFAGITHGQKVHDFIKTLLTRRFVTPLALGTTGRARILHVHHKPLYAAIGEPDNRHRRRVTIERAVERLMVLDGVLANGTVTWLGAERDKRRYNRAALAPLVVVVGVPGSARHASRRGQSTVASNRLAAWSSANRWSCQGRRWLRRVSPCT